MKARKPQKRCDTATGLFFACLIGGAVFVPLFTSKTPEPTAAEIHKEYVEQKRLDAIARKYAIN